MKNVWKKAGSLLLVALLAVALAACGGGNGNNSAGGNETSGANGANGASGGERSEEKTLTPVKVVLDWSPNTNHTGLYVARDKGFYEEEGLAVEIVSPGEAGADAMVAAGNAEFGVSYQESVTFARVQDVPIVSIAAVIQHNTSGFAAPAAKNLKSPKDFEGKKYGGWGSPVEEATLEAMMRNDGADPSQVEIINIGDTDFFTAVKRDIDFAWIYYAWTGVEAELRGEEIDIVYLRDYAPELDYYTPVLITNETMIAENPELVRAFMAATARGYQFAIDQPEAAGELLAEAEPDLDRELVIASQKWLSPRYQDDAPRWGEQKAEVWENYANWLYERNLLDQPLDVENAFTNDFLP